MSDYRVLVPDLCPDNLDLRIPQDTLNEFIVAMLDARRSDLDAFYDGIEADPFDDLGWPNLDDDSEPPYTSDLSPAEQRLIRDFTHETGAELIGNGVSRAVFRVPGLRDYALKVGRWGPDVHRCHGAHQNYFEARMYDTHALATDKDGGEVLLPVVAAAPDFRWILQPFAVTLKAAFGAVEDVYAEDHPIRSPLWDTAEPLREFVSTEGCLPHNIGRWRGRWYILDYARPRYDHSVEDLNQIEGTSTEPLDC